MKMKQMLLMVLFSMVITNSQNMVGSSAQRIRCTVYTAKEGSKTASGEPVRKGIIAGRVDWIGSECVLYDESMNLIGSFEFKDTGATEGLKNGTVIDVFCESEEECDEWRKTYGDYVWLERIENENLDSSFNSN